MGSFILSLCFSKKPINYHFTSEAYLILDDTVSVLVTLFLLLHILVRSIFHCFSLPIQDFLCQFWHITSHMDYVKRKNKPHGFTVLLHQHSFFCSWSSVHELFFNRLMKIFYSTTMQVNDEYMKTLETLSKKIKFIDADPMVKSSKALKDVQPEVERLRQKAVSKVWKTIVGS